MTLAIRRKVLYIVAAATLALMLASATLTAPVFADCQNQTTTSCAG